MQGKMVAGGIAETSCERKGTASKRKIGGQQQRQVAVPGSLLQLMSEVSRRGRWNGCDLRKLKRKRVA